MVCSFSLLRTISLNMGKANSTTPCFTLCIIPLRISRSRYTEYVLEFIFALSRISADTYAGGTVVEESTTKDTGDAKSFKFTDALGWNDIKVYAWDASNNAIGGQWPGTAATFLEENDFGQKVYTINVPKNAAGVIVNGQGGNKQTANITNFAPAGGGYYVDESNRAERVWRNCLHRNSLGRRYSRRDHHQEG